MLISSNHGSSNDQVQTVKSTNVNVETSHSAALANKAHVTSHDYQRRSSR